MSEEIKVNAASIPVLGLLGAVLVILKVLGKISISWIWVLAPFWAPVAFLGILAVGLMLAAIVAALLAS